MNRWKLPRGIRVHPSRSPDFKAGHRAAARSAVAWMYRYAARMNDPKAVAILHSAADSLGQTFAHPPPPPRLPSKKRCSLGPTIRWVDGRGRIRVSFRRFR